MHRGGKQRKKKHKITLESLDMGDEMKKDIDSHNENYHNDSPLRPLRQPSPGVRVDLWRAAAAGVLCCVCGQKVNQKKIKIKKK